MIRQAHNPTVSQRVPCTMLFLLPGNTFGIGFCQQLSNIGIDRHLVFGFNFEDFPPGSGKPVNPLQDIPVGIDALATAPFSQQLHAKRQISARILVQVANAVRSSPSNSI